jgi:hypothetical protein
LLRAKSVRDSRHVARRMSGDKVEILPSQIRLALGVQ